METSTIVIIVIVMALLVKAIRYSGNNNSNIQNHYDPYSMDETSSHCPRCNSAVTTEFCYCPKCGEPLKNKDNIVKMKVN